MQKFYQGRKKVLITLVEKCKSTVERKKTDAKSAKEKFQAWTAVCEVGNFYWRGCSSWPFFFGRGGR